MAAAVHKTTVVPDEPGGAAAPVPTPDPAAWPVLQALVRERKSVRAFRPDAVPAERLRAAFDLARWSPSNCNTQPWTVWLLSGEPRRALARTLLAAIDDMQPDIAYNAQLYPPTLMARRADHLTRKHAALGICREDHDARRAILQANLTSFGAPHVALLYLPAFGNEREAGDIGLYVQTLMLAFAALGIATCPQTSVGLWAGAIRTLLPVPPDLKLMFALAIGYEDTAHLARRLDQSRAPLDDNVHCLG